MSPWLAGGKKVYSYSTCRSGAVLTMYPVWESRRDSPMSGGSHRPCPADRHGSYDAVYPNATSPSDDHCPNARSPLPSICVVGIPSDRIRTMCELDRISEVLRFRRPWQAGDTSELLSGSPADSEYSLVAGLFRFRQPAPEPAC